MGSERSSHPLYLFSMPAPCSVVPGVARTAGQRRKIFDRPEIRPPLHKRLPAVSEDSLDAQQTRPGQEHFRPLKQPRQKERDSRTVAALTQNRHAYLKAIWLWINPSLVTSFSYFYIRIV